MPITPGFDGSVVVASNVPTAGISNLVGLQAGNKPITYGAFSAFSEGSPTVFLPTLMKITTVMTLSSTSKILAKLMLLLTLPIAMVLIYN